MKRPPGVSKVERLGLDPSRVNNGDDPMFDTELNEKSLYKRLRQRAIRRRSKVVLDRKGGGCEDLSDPRIHENPSTPAKLLELSREGAAVFTKAPLCMGETLALILTLGKGDSLRAIAEVIGGKKVEKHGGYMAKFNFLCPNPEQVETIDCFLVEIDSAVAREMKMVL